MVLSITNIRGLLEGRGWAFAMELARQATLAVTAGALVFFEMVPMAAGVTAGGFCAVSALWVVRLRGNAAVEVAS